MTWNYRVVKVNHGENGNTYAIHEVYYERNKIKSWSAAEIAAIGDTKQELIGTLNLMLASCFCKPVLELVDGKLVEIEE